MQARTTRRIVRALHEHHVRNGPPEIAEAVKWFLDRVDPNESDRERRVRSVEDAQQLEGIAERVVIRVYQDSVNERVRLDFVDIDEDVLCRSYLRYERAIKLMEAIGRAIVR